jgi:cold shock CspA family protein
LNVKGIVDKYFEDRAFGFIECEGGGRYFFSERSVIGEVSKGDIVSFSTDDDPRGRPGDVIAVAVERIGPPEPKEPEPGRLFVSNLPRFCSAADLRACFEQVGPVSKIDLVMDPESGESKGYAFVQMQTEKDALQAICDFHGAEWADRRITVKQSYRNAFSRQMARRA